MDDIVNAAKSKALNVAEFFTPVLKESKFKETGVLTPEEFVVAGDHLVHHCPTWQWSAGAASQTKPYLPKDKQMLITRSVPCYRRCWQIDYLGDQEKILDGDDADGGWVDTHHFSADTATDKVREMTLDSKKPADNATASKRGDSHSDDEGEAADMEAFLEREMGIEDENDPNAYYPDKQDVVKDADGEILKTRTYDLNITYDKYYQVPRMWLIGYNENQRLLTVDQMYEDFSQDHAKKTVTVENHPNLPGPPMASIHPCRHAQVMKRLIEQLADNGKELYVHQ